MKKPNTDLLRALVDGVRGQRTLTDSERADVLADLRAEAFWNERAPVLNEEVLALRPLEKFARLVANGGALTEAQADQLQQALQHLDTVRSTPPKVRTNRAA